MNNQLPEVFSNCFVFSSDTHRFETLCSEKGMLKVKSFNTKSYSKEAVYIVQEIFGIASKNSQGIFCCGYLSA